MATMRGIASWSQCTQVQVKKKRILLTKKEFVMNIRELRRIREFNKMPDSFIDEKAYCGPKYMYEMLRIFAQREGKTLLQMYGEMYFQSLHRCVAVNEF